MGSILFGWLVLNSLITLMSILRYSSSSADQIARSAQPVAAYLFLGAATMRRKSRTLWTVLGSLVYMVSLVWTLVVLINQDRFYRMNNLTAYVVFYYIYIGLFLLSFILFISAAFIRCGRPVSRGLFNTLVTTVSAVHSTAAAYPCLSFRFLTAVCSMTQIPRRTTRRFLPFTKNLKTIWIIWRMKGTRRTTPRQNPSVKPPPSPYAAFPVCCHPDRSRTCRAWSGHQTAPRP